MPTIRDMGAIHPCQIPKKNPAGFFSVIMRVPGRQAVSTHTRVSSRIIVPQIFLCLECSIRPPFYVCDYNTIFCTFFNVSVFLLADKKGTWLSDQIPNATAYGKVLLLALYFLPILEQNCS